MLSRCCMACRSAFSISWLVVRFEKGLDCSSKFDKLRWSSPAKASEPDRGKESSSGLLLSLSSNFKKSSSWIRM